MVLRQVLANQDEKTMKQMHKKTTLKNLARRVAMHSRVLAELKSFKGLTAVELADVMDVPRRAAERYLRQLYAEQRVHVGAWLRAEVGTRNGHHPSRVWRAGPGRDAERPAPEPVQQTQARYRAKNGVMIAARRSKPDSSRHNLINNPFYQLMA